MKNDDENVRATFVMTKRNRALLRIVSEKYGVSQSEIMNYAPYMYQVFAKRSLLKREEQLSTAKFLAQKAQVNINKLPKYYIIGDCEELIEHAIGLEELSIKQSQVHGPDEADVYEYTHKYIYGGADPFHDTIIEALEDVGSTSVIEYLKNSPDAYFEESFLDEEEEKANKDFWEFINLQLPNVGETEKTTHSGPTIATWEISLDGDEIKADTGADVLEKFLRYIVEKDVSNLEKMAKVRGRIRPLIAQTKEELYPGRPDLSENSREFVPGWHVGTNYSHKDVNRLLRAAAKEVGLVWGVDVFIKATPKVDG